MGRVGRKWRIVAVICGLSLVGMMGAAGTARAADDRERIEQLEREVQALKAEVARLAAAAAPAGTPAPPSPPSPMALQEIERRLEILAGEVERLKLGEAAVAADQSTHGLGPAASKVYRAKAGVSVGGYGEAVYESFAKRAEDGTPSGLSDQTDLRRAVVYFGYRWNDKYLFNSELEAEHAVSASDKEGELEMEFAYVDRLFRPAANLRAGLVLLPVGLINELHEPTVFLGVDRPATEELIIPTTWREIGVGVYGETRNLAYRSYLTNGLDASRFSGVEGLGEGKGEGSLSRAHDLAWSGRLDFTGVPGLLAGGSLFVGGSGQGLRTGEGRAVGARTTLEELHADWRWRGLQLRGLVARARVADAGALNQALGLAGGEAVASRLEGGYLEAGYNLFSLRPHGERSLVPYARWERVDTQAEMPAGFVRNPSNDRRLLTLGLAYKPIDQLVVKADWRQERTGARTGVDRFALSLGYVF